MLQRGHVHRITLSGGRLRRRAELLPGVHLHVLGEGLVASDQYLAAIGASSARTRGEASSHNLAMPGAQLAEITVVGGLDDVVDLLRGWGHTCDGIPSPRASGNYAERLR